MSQDLRTELKTYMSYLDAQAPAIGIDEIAPAVPPAADPFMNRRRGWLVAAAAAALTVVVVGSIAWFAPFGGQTPPAAEDPTPTTVELTPTTEAAVTTDTVPVTTTTLVALPVVPPGEGPKLSFVQAEAPTDGELRGGEWFEGALYVLSSDRDSQQLFRSTDGFTWELVPGLPEASDILHTMLQTDGDRLVNVVMPNDGNRAIIRRDASIQVNTSTNGVDWTSSRITLPIPEEFNTAAAGQPLGLRLKESFFFSDNFAVGPEGIVVAATINTVSTRGVFASVGYAWFSPDGVEWRRIDSAGPLDGGEFDSIVGTSDGFVAIASSPYRPGDLPPGLQYLSESFDNSVWRSADGITWTEATDLTTRHGFDTSRLIEWQGELIEHVGWAQHSGDDTKTWTLTDPPQSVFSTVPTRGMLLEISEFGLIGTSTYGFEPRTMEILFSADGTNWNRWEPTEFGQGDVLAGAWILGVGDDFVVVQVVEPGPSYSLWVGERSDQ